MNALWLVSMVAGLVWPFYGLAFIACVAGRLRDRAVGVSRRLPSAPPVVAGAFPVALPLWAGVTRGVEHGAPPGAVGWASSVLLGLGATSLIVAGWAAWRCRGRWTVAVAVSLAALAATLAGLFVGAMSIADEWL